MTLQKNQTSKLYTVDDIVASCNACGAYTLTRDPKLIKHHPNCGGLPEIEKWDRYYNDPEWTKAIEGEGLDNTYNICYNKGVR